MLKDANNPMENIVGINGEETIIPTNSKYNPPSGKKFMGWDIKNGDNTAIYVAGQKIALSTNMILYAVWGE